MWPKGESVVKGRGGEEGCESNFQLRWTEGTGLDIGFLPASDALCVSNPDHVGGRQFHTQDVIAEWELSAQLGNIFSSRENTRQAYWNSEVANSTFCLCSRRGWHAASPPLCFLHPMLHQVLHSSCPFPPPPWSCVMCSRLSEPQRKWGRQSHWQPGALAQRFPLSPLHAHTIHTIQNK